MTNFNKTDIDEFNEKFDIEYEAEAISIRKEFLRTFPKERLGDLRVDEYVIGKRNRSFCSLIEAKSRNWANIQGATSRKFGLYYGRTKSNSTKKYRPSKKFGTTKVDAFKEIRKSLCALIKDGDKNNFEAIDNNPLSQMVKAKILSLYFPNRYINICSESHINKIASALNLPESEYLSEKQHLIVKAKLNDKRIRAWSNPKYMQFLYHTYHPEHARKFRSIGLRTPSSKELRKVNMEEVQGKRNRIGKISEKFALNWEKQRLKSLGYEGLVSKIQDRTDRPGYGYDFLSHTKPGKKRYIEVKTLARRGKSTFRFFMSENEFEKSESKLKPGYYFYLVLMESESEPISVEVISSKEVHEKGVFSTAVHQVHIDISEN